MYLQSENYIVLCRFADVYQYICLPFLGRQLYFSTAEKKENKKGGKESKTMKKLKTSGKSY